MNTATFFLHQKYEAALKAAGAFALCFSLLFSGAAAAQVYKCKGDDGRVVYSDARCGIREERTEVDVRDSVIETSDDAKRVRRNLTQLEKDAAAGERQRLKEEQERAASRRKTSTRKAARETSEADGTPEHRRRVGAQQRRIRATQRAQQQRVTPYSQR